jgi:hypothetical protein
VNEKQLFGVLVRAIGVLVVLDGAREFWFVLARVAFLEPESVFRYPVSQDLLYGFVIIVLGSTMIRWPEWIVRLAWLERLPTIGRMPDDEN